MMDQHMMKNFDENTARIIPPSTAVSILAIPLFENDGLTTVGMVDPSNQHAASKLYDLFGKGIQIIKISQSEFDVF